MGSRLEANSAAVRKRIENHTFENEEGEEYAGSKFGGFTDYFRRKKIKLQNRDVERRLVSQKPQIFRGIVAHVNGYTQPSLNDLHDLIVDHGGGFMQYLDGKTTVTHIIASNITPKKKVEFRRYRMVKPAWIVDSVDAGKLLPWDAYRLLDEGVGQHVLSLEGGTINSQASTARSGYKQFSDTSWYTNQLKDATKQLKGQGKYNTHDGPDLESKQTGMEHDDETPQFPELETEDEELQAEVSHLKGEALSPSTGWDHEQEARGVGDAINQGDTATDTKQTLPNVTAASTTNILEKTLPDVSTRDIAPQTRSNEQEQPPDLEAIPSPTKKRALTAEEHNANLLKDPRVWKSTVVNPKFLKQYYEESRLHHLSTWKADLKSQLQALANERSSSQKARQKLAPGCRRYVLHVDFDCFFVAVSLKKCPELVDLPVVVAHGGGSGSEIASCNYVARKFGIKNGMWMKGAQEMCPDLRVLPYDFKAYEEASRAFYEVIISTGGIVQSVSVDEALVDISQICIEAGGSDGKAHSEGSIYREQAKANAVAQDIRYDIKRITGCAVSVGIGGNILLAKVAMRKAKPAGQYQILPEEIVEILGELKMQELPGIAYSIGGKLEEIGVKFVKDVRKLTKEKLMAALGPKTGEKIWDYSRGIDRVDVGEQVVRKSVSAEVNWGIRFVTQEQADEFVSSLCEELSKRLLTEKVKGKQLTMKIMRRAADAPLDPPKHLGHGKCDTYNKSVQLNLATNAKEVLSREAISIMHGWGFPPGELRGIGVQVTKLEPLKANVAAVDSSQKRLQFGTPGSKTKAIKFQDPIVDPKSPEKKHSGSIQPAAAFIAADHEVGAKPLNTGGTQFILPTQVDPSILAELPQDIRSRFAAKLIQGVPGDHTINSPATSRSQSPSHSIPTASQLDPEALAALPDDVRAEVLEYYSRAPNTSRNQTLLPQSPRKDRAIKLSTKKLLTTPTKKRIGLLEARRSPRQHAGSTLTQANFVSRLPASKNEQADATNASATEDTVEELSAEFLNALPPSIRAELLAHQRQSRLKRAGIDIPQSRPNHHYYANALLDDTHPEPVIHLPPPPPKLTFTRAHLSAAADLRAMILEWVEDVGMEEPNGEDVDTLLAYLKRVVVEERDLAKAVGVVKWLAWLVGEKMVERWWQTALGSIKHGIGQTATARGLGVGRVVFD